MNEKFSTEGIEEVTSILGHSLFALKIKKQLENSGQLDRFPEFKNRSWEYVVMGDYETKQMGRVPKGLLHALKNESPIIIFGTGATCMIKDTGEILTRQEWEKRGLGVAEVEWESQFTIRYLIEHIEDLFRFPELAKILEEMFGDDIDAITDHISSISIADYDSWNTATEIKEALKKCRKKPEIGYISRITNPCHCARTAASSVFPDEGIEISVFPCETDFCMDKGDPVVIFEPASGVLTEAELAGTHLYANRVLNGFWGMKYEKQQEFLKIAEKFFSENKK